MDFYIWMAIVAIFSFMVGVVIACWIMNLPHAGALVISDDYEEGSYIFLRISRKGMDAIQKHNVVRLDVERINVDANKTR